MKPIITLSFISVIIFTTLSFSFHGNNTGKKAAKPEADFAVVELFTSEGCSSCPPADEVIIKLAKEFPGNVYFLGYHVDYWDYIGWKDVFSKSDYTERQRKYADAFGLSSVYTPQVVVNGEKEFVGSKESQLRTTIQQELKGVASAGIEITAKKAGTDNITVSYKIANTGQGFLNIALVQSMATTNVKRGENKGHHLDHINVVRELKTITINKEANAAVDFKIPSDLSSKDVKLIAFIQDKKGLKIQGAAGTIVKK
jgi:hypothetical protein